jgi:hypothetical protein
MWRARHVHQYLHKYTSFDIFCISTFISISECWKQSATIIMDWFLNYQSFLSRNVINNWPIDWFLVCFIIYSRSVIWWNFRACIATNKIFWTRNFIKPIKNLYQLPTFLSLSFWRASFRFMNVSNQRKSGGAKDHCVRGNWKIIKMIDYFQTNPNSNFSRKF